VNANVFHGNGSGVGECLEQLHLIRSGDVLRCPIVADCADGIVGADWHHRQTADVGWAVCFGGDSWVLINIGDRHRQTVGHNPSADADAPRKALAFPEWFDGIFVGVVALVAVAQHERCAVGAGQFTGGGAHDRHDLLQVAGERKALYHFDEIFCGFRDGVGERKLAAKGHPFIREFCWANRVRTHRIVANRIGLNHEAPPGNYLLGLEVT
jgi:hypothetical protein